MSTSRKVVGVLPPMFLACLVMIQVLYSTFYSANQTRQHLKLNEKLNWTKKLDLAFKNKQSPIAALNVSQSNSVNSSMAAVGSSTSSMKTILYYTRYFSWDDFLFGFGQQAFLKANCPVNNCFATNNRSHFASLGQFDALIFHMRDINEKTEFPDPTQRSRTQHYVMYLAESPVHDFFNYSGFPSFFNWTMTYRMDSDFPRPYGWIMPKNAADNANAPSINNLYNLTYPMGNRTLLEKIEHDLVTKSKEKKLVAWMVSNCVTNSKREVLVAKLQNFVQVDVYGNCGPFNCTKSGDYDPDCMPMVGDNYKFYLSFENSLCRDYITEKFWKVLNYNVVPLVFGGGNYSLYAPKKSYIDVQDFESIKDLADYLIYLDSNATAYAEFFEWKEYFKVSFDYNRPFCHLCEALNRPQEYPPKIAENLHQWWRTDANCKAGNDLPLLNAD